MASESISALILLIASLIVAGGVASVAIGSVDRVSDSVLDQSVDTSEDIRTDIAIVSDPGAPSGITDNDNAANSSEWIIHVKNTGTTGLAAAPEQVDVLINGQYARVTRVEVIGGPNDGGWPRYSVARVGIDMSTVTQPSGDVRVQVLVNGNRDYIEFRAP